MNKVILVGRFTSEPKIFITKNQIKQARFNIACNDKWNKKETYFFSCVAWVKTAEFIEKYVHKGTLVALDGRLIVRNYRNYNNQDVKVTEIVVEDVSVLSYPKEKTEPTKYPITKDRYSDYVGSNEYDYQTQEENNFQEFHYQETKPHVKKPEANLSENDDFTLEQNDDLFAGSLFNDEDFDEQNELDVSDEDEVEKNDNNQFKNKF